jgi:hypothetical protein
MFYTERLNYKSLNVRSDHFKNILPVIHDIQKVAKGGHELDPHDYLLIRDNEDPQITSKRVEKFAPENYFGAAVRLQRIHQKSGVIEIKPDSLPGVMLNDNKNDSGVNWLSLWENFFTSVDKKNNSLKDFVLDVFTQALVCKYAYVQVELENISEDQIETNQAIAEEIQILRKPYYFHLPVSSIMAEKNNGDSLEWVKYKRLDIVDDPFYKTIYNMTYVLIDNEHISEWTFYDVLVDSGEILKIWDSTLNNGKGGYRTIKPEEDYADVVSIAHRRGACPVVKYKMDDSLWMADQVYLAQKIIYGLSMNMLHTASNAGFIQKWLRPYIAGNDTRISKESGGASYIPLPKEALGEIIKKYAESMGDESVIMADFFTFEEVKGDSVVMIEKLIDRLKNYIFTTILFNNARFEQTSSDQQSGTAKEIDFYVQNLALKDHGSNIIEFTKNLIKHTSRAFGFTDLSVLSGVNVSGMDRFDIRPLDNVLELLERILKLPNVTLLLPEELLIEIMSQLSRLIVENTTYEYKNDLDSAIIKKVQAYLSSLPESTQPGI